MKISTAMGGALLLCFTGLNGQTTLDSLRMPFDSLNPANVPTGALLEWSGFNPAIGVNLNAHNGSFNTSPIWESQYVGLYRIFSLMQFTPTMMAPGIYDSLAFFEDNQAYDVPIGAFHLNYNMIDSNALANGAIGYDTAVNKYYDIPNQNPYWDRRGFAATHFAGVVMPQFTMNYIFVPDPTYPPNLISVPNFSFQLEYKLVGELFFSNDPRPLQSIKIDFDNGDGFQPVQKDQSIFVNYEHNETTFPCDGPYCDLELRIRLYYAQPNGGIDSLQAKFYLTLAMVAPPDVELTSSGLNLVNPCPIQYDRSPAEAKYYLIYGNPDSVIRKPVIFIEGFDLGLRDYGNLNWSGFRTGKFSDEAGNHDIAPNLNKLPHMLDSLKSHGYDVLIVDHRNGRNYIEANAGATIRLIQWLNQELDNNGSTEEIVVLGASMGGLIARYALRKMEIDGCCHNVRMYGTFDSPHGGANVPLGIQKMVQTMAYKMPVSFVFEDMRRAYEYGLCSPGAAQMLKYHVNVISPFNPSNLFGNPAYWNYNPWRTIYGNMDYQKIRSEWEHLLDSIGHPQDAFKINIVNGSINGTHQAFPPGALLFDFMIDIDAPIDYPNTYQSWPIHGMKAYAIGPNANNIILTRRGILASVTSSLLYTFNFATYLAGLPSMIWGGYPFNSIMNDFHQANAALSTNHYQNTSLLPYDNCPGSTAPTMIQIQGEFVNVLCGYVFQNTLAKQHTHSFVATVSALDLDTVALGSNYYSSIDPFVRLRKIPFDTLWFPAEFDNRGNLIASVNQRHVDMTTENLAWILSNIEANANFLSTQGQSALYKNLTNVFNFGRKHRKFIRQLDIDFGGYALVNHNLYGYDYAGYLNGNRPQPGSNFDVYTSASNCNGSWVNIKNGGVFEVGGDSSTADVHIKKGTFLQIFSGGVLKINNYSNVIIEPGASLIIHPGATIYLNGEDAVLDLQGNVELKQDASFTFIGSGFVRYAMNHQQGAQWSLEGNNTFVMRGANRNDLVMQIEEDAYLEDFEQVTFAKGRVEFPEYKALHIGSPVKIDTALFAPSDTSNLSSAGFFGVILQGSKNQTVSNSRFIGASFGLANNGLRGFGVTIEKSYFVKNTIGVRLEGPGGRILNSRFYSNETGLDANNITLEVRAELCQFKFNDQLGIAFSGSDGNASIKVLSSQVSNNNWSGLQAMNGTVQTRCSQFNQNTYAGIIADRSRIILRGTTVSSNQIGFTGVGLALLNINNGYNAFINNSSTIDFEALLDASYSSLFTTTFKAMKNDVSSSISIGKINGPLTVILSAPASPTGAFFYPVIHCMSAQPAGGSPFGGTLSNLNPIGTNGNSCDSCRFYVGSTMEIALEDIYARLEERNSSTLLEDIYRADEIAMVYEDKALNPSDQLLRDFALMAEVEGLAAAFSEGLLVPGDDVEYTNLVINRLQSVQYDTTASGQERRFSNKIAQALTYRLNHDYTNALSLLNTYPSFATTPVQTNQALYWTCALEGERDLLNGALSFDEFLVWNATCAQTFGMRGPQAAFEPSPVVWEQAPLAVGAQPNPATERTTVAFSHPVEGTLTLVDLMGTAVAGPYNLQGAEQLEVPLALPAGVYVVVVQTTTAERATCKLVIH